MTTSISEGSMSSETGIQTNKQTNKRMNRPEIKIYLFINGTVPTTIRASKLTQKESDRLLEETRGGVETNRSKHCIHSIDHIISMKGEPPLWVNMYRTIMYTT